MRYGFETDSLLQSDISIHELSLPEVRRLFYLVAQAILSLELSAEHVDVLFLTHLRDAVRRFEQLYGSSLYPKDSDS
jgi:hypothetical protein